jgi:hypothetical protein
MEMEEGGREGRRKGRRELAQTTTGMAGEAYIFCPALNNVARGSRSLLKDEGHWHSSMKRYLLL